MEDQISQGPNHHSSERTEPVRSRWTPKPEQILILESIFDSGMVNPPKDETVRIRKLLEKFGPVGDANVFYWFQNRRSRSRRRQRQIEAGLSGEETSTVNHGHGHGTIHFDAISRNSNSNTSAGSGGGGGNGCFENADPNFFQSPSFVGSTSSSGGVEDLFLYSGQMGFQVIEQSTVGANSSMGITSNSANLHYQSGVITVFINGVPTEIPRGPLDMKAMFGEDLVLLHSSGIPVPFNDYGFSLETLHHGESYFLILCDDYRFRGTLKKEFYMLRRPVIDERGV
ncbi:hypothetical protein LguiB_004040 [Lonicera macranthoides]